MILQLKRAINWATRETSLSSADSYTAWPGTGNYHTFAFSAWRHLRFSKTTRKWNEHNERLDTKTICKFESEVPVPILGFKVSLHISCNVDTCIPVCATKMPANASLGLHPFSALKSFFVCYMYIVNYIKASKALNWFHGCNVNVLWVCWMFTSLWQTYEWPWKFKIRREAIIRIRDTQSLFYTHIPIIFTKMSPYGYLVIACTRKAFNGHQRDVTLIINKGDQYILIIYNMWHIGLT